MYENYRSPPNTDWDTNSKTNNFVDDPSLSTFNADTVCDGLYQYFKKMNSSYTSGHLLVPMGEDFYYANSFENFDNTDRLIAYFNKKYGMDF